MFRKSTFPLPFARRGATASKAAGFTLVELMVALGIIVILASIIGPRIGRAMDNAKAQKCRNNLKQLHSAVLAFAADHGGNLPAAQTFEGFDTKSREFYVDAEDGSFRNGGWVSWVPKDLKADKLQSTYYKDGKKTNKRKESHASDFCDDLGTGAYARFAVENGVLFDYAGDMSFYVCPLIRAEFAEALEFSPDEEVSDTANGGGIYRTYAMNPYFRCSQRPAYDRLSSKVGVSYSYGGHVPEASKLLLFTEVAPSTDDPPSRKNRTDEARNNHWKHDGCINPTHWNSTGENDELIYAAHPAKNERGPVTDRKTGKVKTDWLPCALAVFFDGHIETVMPTIGKGNTAWFLNRGWTPTDDPSTEIKSNHYD